LKDLAQAGQLPRFASFYLAAYHRRFDQIFYFSYDPGDTAIAGLRLLPGAPLGKRILYSFLMPFFRWRQLRQCDVIRVTQAEGGLPAVLAKLFLGAPYVASYGFHYSRAAYQDKGLLRAMLASFTTRLTIQFADALIATTPILKRYLESFVPAERVHLIPNGVDTALFHPAAPDAPREGLIYVGRLAPQKRLDLLLRAVALLPKPVPVTLVGAGSLEADLRQLASELGLEVRFLGVVPHPELPELLRQAKAFVLPSKWEGHPKALLEAMAVGLPCVGRDVPGTRDVLVDGETGLLVDSETPAALAAAIQRLLEDAPLAAQLGAAARDFIADHYELNILLERELDLLEGVARDARP
jgi:glycosyltransferase involved in cell wall biosynthesis